MKRGWYRTRSYPHFDRPISFDAALAYVTDPEKVATHSFLPFISYLTETPRYRKDKRKVIKKPRLLAYAAHLDSHIFAYYSQLLAERLELVYKCESCGPCVPAYRALGKSNIDFANSAFDDTDELAPCVAKAFDISGFFDNLDHRLLKNAWANLIGEPTLPHGHRVEQRQASSAIRVFPIDSPVRWVLISLSLAWHC